MNEHDESEKISPPIISVPESAPIKPAPKPFSYWAKRFLVCNPFYLVSAALLLFGMYRISVDANFFTEEISQLVFNLSSLEFYEVLLVVTAIFLASRRIWYDSTLLVGLENLFIFVPFILVSQVALISTRAVWVVCAVTAIVAIARMASLKRYFAELNMPNRLLLIGSALLAINIGLLAAYRVVCQTKMGWQPDSTDTSPEFRFNQLTWLVILPAALAMANFLPHARGMGSLVPQRRWLPAGFCALWMMATGMHLYCLNYVYNFAFRIEMIVPAVWMLMWVAYRKLPEFLETEARGLQHALAVGALLTPFVAVSASGTKIFFALMALNTLIYSVMYLRNCDRNFVRHLLFASAVLLVCGLPSEWIRVITPSLQRATYIGVGAAVYLMLYAVLSRNPKVGIFGSMLMAFIVVNAFPRHESSVSWAVQCGLVFLLLHSLRWVDIEHQGAATVRVMAGVLWVLHTVAWVRSDVAMWMPCIPGAIVLGAYVVTQFLRGRWDTFILPAASTLTVLSGPGNFLIQKIQSAPMGLLAVVGSFLLFALGTAAALTKHRWHRTSV